MIQPPPRPPASVVAEPKPSDTTSVSPWDRRESLVKEVVDEIRRDALKEDALKKLRKADWPDRISKFFQHPAALLVIGFALTGWIGGSLANAWQRNEWERQQLRLIEIHGIELKYGIIDDVTKAVGERNAAARGVLYPLLDDLDNRVLTQEEAEPIKNWQKATQDWLVNSQTLELKIAAHIRNPEALASFKQIFEREKTITGKMAYIKRHLAEFNHQETNEDAQRDLDEIYDNIYGTGDDLTKLTAIITAEVQADARGQ